MVELQQKLERGHCYGYSKFRVLNLAERGLRNSSLCAGYEVSMVETFKEYEDELSQTAYNHGYQIGTYVAEMTNLAETGKCMTVKWFEAQKFAKKQKEMYEKWIDKK